MKTFFFLPLEYIFPLSIFDCSRIPPFPFENPQYAIAWERHFTVAVLASISKLMSNFYKAKNINKKFQADSNILESS